MLLITYLDNLNDEQTGIALDAEGLIPARKMVHQISSHALVALQYTIIMVCAARPAM